MTDIPYASNGALVRLHLKTFLNVRGDRDNVFKRLAQIVALDNSLRPKVKVRALMVLSQLEAVFETKININSHPLVNRDSRMSRSFELVESLSEGLMTKVMRVLVSAGDGLISENPTYFRSSRFSIEGFGRMSLFRSFSEPRLQAKWDRVASLARAVTQRFQLISVTLNSVNLLFDVPQHFNSDLDAIDHLSESNHSISSWISESVSAVRAT